MGMVKEALFDIKEHLAELEGCVDVAYVEISKILATGLYKKQFSDHLKKGNDLNMVKKLLLSCATIIEEEQAAFEDKCFPEEY